MVHDNESREQLSEWLLYVRKFPKHSSGLAYLIFTSTVCNRQYYSNSLMHKDTHLGSRGLCSLTPTSYPPVSLRKEALGLMNVQEMHPLPMGCLGGDCSQAIVSIWWNRTGALPPCFCVKDVQLPLVFLFRGWASGTLTRSRLLFRGVLCLVEGQGCSGMPLWRTDWWVWFLSPEPVVLSITHLSKLPPPFLMWLLLQLVGVGAAGFPWP